MLSPVGDAAGAGSTGTAGGGASVSWAAAAQQIAAKRLARAPELLFADTERI